MMFTGQHKAVPVKSHGCSVAVRRSKPMKTKGQDVQK